MIGFVSQGAVVFRGICHPLLKINDFIAVANFVAVRSARNFPVIREQFPEMQPETAVLSNDSVLINVSDCNQSFALPMKYITFILLTIFENHYLRMIPLPH